MQKNRLGNFPTRFIIEPLFCLILDNQGQLTCFTIPVRLSTPDTSNGKAISLLKITVGDDKGFLGNTRGIWKEN